MSANPHIRLIPNLQNFSIEFRLHLLQVARANTAKSDIRSISVQNSSKANHKAKTMPDRLRAFFETNLGVYVAIAAVILGVLAAIGCLFLDCV